MEPNVGRNLLQAFVKILSSLECPICYNYVSTPIFQCYSGHILCETCKRGIDVCPTCRVTMPNHDVRVRSLEDISSEMIFPCRNDGCDKILELQELKRHEDSCEHANASGGRVTEKDRHSQHNYSTLLLHVEQQLSPFFITDSKRIILHAETQTDEPSRSGKGPYISSGKMGLINLDEIELASNGQLSNSDSFADKSHEINHLSEFLKEKLFSTDENNESDSKKIITLGLSKIPFSDSSESGSIDEDIAEEDASQMLSESLGGILNSSEETYKLKDNVFKSVSGDEDNDDTNNSSENLSDCELTGLNHSESEPDNYSRNIFAKLLQTLLFKDNNNANSEELDVIHSENESTNLQTNNTPLSDDLTKLVENLLKSNNKNSSKVFNIGRNTPKNKTKKQVNSSQKKKKDKYTLKNKASTNVQPFDFSQSHDRLLANLLKEQGDSGSDNEKQ